MNEDKHISTWTKEERFWVKVVRGPDCWNWNGGKLVEGYGRFVDRGKYVLAHRVSWEIHNGPIPEGLCVLHRCDNPPCTNPDHLFVGTHGDNARDRAAKGRNGKWRRPTPAQPQADDCWTCKRNGAGNDCTHPGLCSSASLIEWIQLAVDTESLMPQRSNTTSCPGWSGGEERGKP